MIFVDTHTHLFSTEFSGDVDEVVLRAINADVKYLFLPNIDYETIAPLTVLCKRWPNNCFPLVGLHPCHVKEHFSQELQNIRNTFGEQKIYGIGEIGLDLYWDKTFFQLQKQAFIEQLNWAVEINLPVVIHSRNAVDEVLELISEPFYEKLSGIMHCFSGTIEQANKAIDNGFIIGLGGVITYAKSGMESLVKEVPLNKIVIETDSPYLTPAPFRGKRNESSYIPYIAKRIADIKSISIEEVATITSQNAFEIFRF